jgi:hypothetical protein
VGDLAAALQQQLQVGCLPATTLSVEHVVHELQLHPQWWRGSQGPGSRVGVGIGGRRQPRCEEGKTEPRGEWLGKGGLGRIEKRTGQVATEASNVNTIPPSIELLLGVS